MLDLAGAWSLWLGVRLIGKRSAPAWLKAAAALAFAAPIGAVVGLWYRVFVVWNPAAQRRRLK